MMNHESIPLYYLCSLAGFVMVAGGIWLIYKQKVYVDKETKEVIEIATPLGKFKTNVPALALFVLGFVPLIYPVVMVTDYGKEVRKKIPIVGKVKSKAHPVEVYAVVDFDSLRNDRDFKLMVPPTDRDYKVIYIVGDKIVGKERAERQSDKDEEISVPDQDMTVAEAPEYEPEVTPVPRQFR